MQLNQTASDCKGNILVVDDTPDNLRLLSAMLTAQGYEVRKALNGKIALTACQTLLPDVILLDINMPGMDGYEVCRQLKADDTTSDVPVIFISALDDVLDKVKAFDVGGADYITKPFHGAEVILRIENQINLRLLQIKLREKNILLQQTVDELRDSQVQRIQSEKMAALGQMVAGVAHEVNNPVSFIYGNLQYANQYVQELVKIIEVYQQEYPNPTPNLQHLLQDTDLKFLVNDLQNLIGAMYRGADRIRQIVLALQNFSRLDEAAIKLVDIHEGIESTLVMLEHRLRSTSQRPEISVIREYARLPHVACYTSELNQVFMHLFNNAIDALDLKMGFAHMANLEGPITRVNCEGEPDDRNSRFLNPDPKIHVRTQMVDSNKIKIAIADNGPGMNEFVLTRAFDPFFTTKPVGKGSGLGLSISYQIVVQKHRGQILCASKLGRGTELTIEIPINQPGY